jgi:transcriptional regulator with XRE-family HTH domain
MPRTRIGTNIKLLRKSWGQTQKELGRALGVESNTISMYESGARTPDATVLNSIAAYYGIPLDSLIHEDLSHMPLRTSLITWDDIVTLLEKVLPAIPLNKDDADPHFLKGYERIQRIQNSMKQPGGLIFRGTILDAFDDFGKSLSEYSTIESVANILWLLFLLYMLLPDEHAIKAGEAIMNGQGNKKDFSKKYILKGSNPISQENLKRKQDYAADQHDGIIEFIKTLKETPEYSALGDYYLALQYILGMVVNENTADLNQQIGMEMMNTYLELGNPYALAYFKALMSFINHKS